MIYMKETFQKIADYKITVISYVRIFKTFSIVKDLNIYSPVKDLNIYSPVFGGLVDD